MKHLQNGILCGMVLVVMLVQSTFAQAQRQPNIVLIMTDDQGYGDLKCHGNEQIKTPNMDKLHGQSVRLTNYHVDPTCSPTRSALMTGRYSSRTGVWHTIMGRSMMHTDELTIAEVFSKAGYKTGIFGKWHLGDNFPCRPQDQGFQEVLVHGGGGVTQTPDYWGNDYFGDTYFHNGQPKKFEKYCTDVWFDEAMGFIEKNKDRPFLAYIPTNAPHGPYLVDEKYSKPYKDMGIKSPRAEFYGMITNIDENLGRLDRKLKELNLTDNTILIFTTDNGTAAGSRNGGFNAGMRGSKGSEYDGGHRVPFFIRWPNGKIEGGRDVPQLSAHIDVLPTLAALCKVDVPQSAKVDGMSLVPLLGTSKETDWPARTLAVHSQRLEHPKKWRKAAVMTDRWRLVTDEKRRELFDMQQDPGQKNNVAQQHPDVFKQLSAAYETWYKSISTRFEDYVRIGLGDDAENPARLTCHDWHTDDKIVPWNQPSVARQPKSNGFWAVDVTKAGKYEFTLRLRPHYVKPGVPINAMFGEVSIFSDQQGMAGGGTLEPKATSLTIPVILEKGPVRLSTELSGPKGKYGAYFVDVKYLGPDKKAAARTKNGIRELLELGPASTEKELEVDQFLNQLFRGPSTNREKQPDNAKSSPFKRPLDFGVGDPLKPADTKPQDEKKAIDANLDRLLELDNDRPKPKAKKPTGRDELDRLLDLNEDKPITPASKNQPMQPDKVGNRINTTHGSVRFIRLQYNGGDWDQKFGVGADLNMLIEYGIRTTHRVASKTESRTLAQVKTFRKFKSPAMIFLTGQKSINLSDQEVAILKEYLLDKHGMLFISNGGSAHFHKQVLAMMKRVLPDGKQVEVPKDDKLYRVPYPIPNLPYVTPHGGKTALGWKVDGRWAVYYHPGDIAAAWADDHAGVPPVIWEACYQLGTNILFYSEAEYSKWVVSQSRK